MDGLPAFSDLTEDDFDELLAEEKSLIQSASQDAMWVEVITRICEYRIGTMKACITTKAVKRLIEAGLAGVTTQVTTAKAVIIQMLNDQPYLRDEDPQRALLKIIYYQWFTQEQRKHRTDSRASSRPSSRASTRTVKAESEEEAAAREEFKMFMEWKKMQSQKSEEEPPAPKEE